VLDLDGQGFSFAPGGATVLFDLNADGEPERIPALGPGNGMLVWDLDGSGSIEDGREVIGEDFSGRSFANSIEALRSLDANDDGVLDARDAAFSQLQVWQDADTDGVAGPGELHSFGSLGLASVSLATQAADLVIEGQNVFATGSFEWSDGSGGAFVGVAFNTVPSRQTDAQSRMVDETGAMDRPGNVDMVPALDMIEPFGDASSAAPSEAIKLDFDAGLDFASVPGKEPAVGGGVVPSILGETNLAGPKFGAADWATVPLDTESAIVEVGLAVDDHANLARHGVFDYGAAA
jgi:hypothetical protein